MTDNEALWTFSVFKCVRDSVGRQWAATSNEELSVGKDVRRSYPLPTSPCLMNQLPKKLRVFDVGGKDALGAIDGDVSHISNVIDTH